MKRNDRTLLAERQYLSQRKHILSQFHPEDGSQGLIDQFCLKLALLSSSFGSFLLSNTCAPQNRGKNLLL